MPSMFDPRFRQLWHAFLDFFQFAPSQLTLTLLLMLFQGLTAGVGLLLIIPLLQLVGFSFAEQMDSGLANRVGALFAELDIQLTLPAVLFIYICVVTSIATTRYWLTVLSATIQQRYINFIRNRLYSALLKSNWQFIVQHKMSDFTHSLTGQVQSIGYMAQQMLQLLSNIILTLVYVLFALLLSWQMCLLALACAAGLLLVLLPFNKVIYHSGEIQLTSFKSIFQMLTEQLASLKMIKSYASETHYAKQVAQTSELLEQQQIKMTRINALTQWVFMVGAVIAFSVLFYFSLQWLSVPLATLLLLLLIFSRLLPQVLGIHSTYQRLLHQIPALHDVKQMLKHCQDAQEGELSARLVTPQLKHKIVLKNVSYCYPGQKKPVIDCFNMEIKRNQTVALVGVSGAGKSTLADLIVGLLVPDSGRIFCDDTPLCGEQRLAWRRSLAYVTQEVFLFHQSIRHNLTWVKPDASEAELWRVLQLAAADDFIRQLPHGLDTVIGDRGVRLSGGERQRLALARALLSNPQLLILDEATSALDHDNEQKIQQALLKLQGKLTIVIIAHRNTTIQHVDAIVRLGRNSDQQILAVCEEA
ncbi:MAG TPA: ABC transporter ATP-binding protein [Crenotrichaceae bacterium]|nr:ABC transporter ATP-binding protein [Crenotrichaceae bacterium]